MFRLFSGHFFFLVSQIIIVLIECAAPGQMSKVYSEKYCDCVYNTGKISSRPKRNKIISQKLRKANEKGFRIEEVIKKKGNKLYVKWKGYHNSFNSWIDKKNVI